MTICPLFQATVTCDMAEAQPRLRGGAAVAAVHGRCCAGAAAHGGCAAAARRLRGGCAAAAARRLRAIDGRCAARRLRDRWHAWPLRGGAIAAARRRDSLCTAVRIRGGAMAAARGAMAAVRRRDGRCVAARSMAALWWRVHCRGRRWCITALLTIRGGVSCASCDKASRYVAATCTSTSPASRSSCLLPLFR